MKEFIELTGASGAAYRFRLWQTGAPHAPIAGNYLCVRVEGADYAIVSIGEVTDLSRAREQLAKKVRDTTTHIYTRLNVARAAREAEHADLMARHAPAPARTRAPAA